MILDIENSKMRSSVYKLYRWMCAETDRSCVLTAQTSDIRKAIGLCENAIIKARNELVRLCLIRAELMGGPGGGYHFTMMNPKTSLPIEWGVRSRPQFFRVPYASTLSSIFPEKWSGTDALVYDELCQRMGQSGINEVPRTECHWLKQISKNTLNAAERHLAETGFIRVTDSIIEVLHPETSQSMPARAWNQEPSDRAYYVEKDTGFRKVFTEELLTPQVIETYFRKSLPRPEEWNGGDAHCPFHDDQTPSLSINTETGQFCCHGCGAAGNKLVTFEMRLMETEDVQAAFTSVARKIGVTLCPRGRGKVTHQHEYVDAKGIPQYLLRRYEDGTASFYHYQGSFLKPGLKRRKRLLYNLPQVIQAQVVLIVEGEKKADILSALGLCDPNGRPVAVTATGGADSWHTEFVEHLLGKQVLLLPDCDDPGITYSDSVEASLQRVGIEFNTVYFNEFGNDFRCYLETFGKESFVRYLDCPWVALSPVLPAFIGTGEISI